MKRLRLIMCFYRSAFITIPRFQIGRTVRLVECVDTSSRALFNKLLRDSIVKVRWEVEWYEEADDSGDGAQFRQWIPYIAKYYIRLSNQVLQLEGRVW